MVASRTLGRESLNVRCLTTTDADVSCSIRLSSALALVVAGCGADPGTEQQRSMPTSARAGALPEQLYDVSFARSDVRAPTHIVARAQTTKRMRAVRPGHEPTEETITLAMRIAGVRRELDPTTEEIVVEQCIADSTGEPEQLLPPGARLLIEQRVEPEEGRYLVEGHEVSAYVRSHLDLFFTRMTSDGTRNAGTSDEEWFGAGGHRRRTGESWPIHTKAVVASMSRTFPGLRESDVRGSATLHGVMDRYGESFLDLGLEVSTQLRQLPGSAELPPGTRLEQGELSISARRLQPRRPGIPAASRRQDVHARVTVTVPVRTGGVARLEIQFHDAYSVTEQLR